MPQDRDRSDTPSGKPDRRRDEPDRLPGESPATDADAHPEEPGAYIGRLPEREADTIAGGVRPDDERIAAYGSTSGVVRDPDETPAGHREGRPADNDEIREAGKDR